MDNPSYSNPHPATVMDEFNARARDLTFVGSSFACIALDMYRVIVDDERAMDTYTVFMTRCISSGLWRMTCTCGDDCRHCAWLLLRAVGLGLAMMPGQARSDAVRLLIHSLSGNRPWDEFSSIPSLAPHEDVVPPDPTEECPVCYDELSDKRSVRCGRCACLFHRACVARWAKSCPTCRDPLQFTDLDPTIPRTRWYPEPGEVVAGWDHLPTVPPRRYPDTVLDSDSDSDSGPGNDSYSLTSIESDGQDPNDPVLAGYLLGFFPSRPADVDEDEDEDAVPPLEEESEALNE